MNRVFLTFLEAEIESFHPLRWVAGIAILLPLALAIALLAAKIGGGNAERWLRWLRYVLTVEALGLVVLCTIGYFYERQAEARDARLYPPPGGLVDIGGYRLHLNCLGDGGPTVVLEYGLEGSYFDWRRVQPEIAKFTRVCAYDRAGYGWSDTSPRPRTASVVAEELHTLLRAAGEKPPYIVVGHSLGSLYVQMFAYKFPDETAGIVLVDGFVLHGKPWFPLSYKIWLRFLQWTTPFGLPRWRGWCGGGVAELKGEAEAATCRSKVYAAYYDEHSHVAESSEEVQAIQSFGAIPLIVIVRDPAAGHDRDEEARHMEEQRNLLKLSSNARFVVADGSGHDIPLARPDVVIEAVKSLISVRAPADSRGTP